MSGAKAQGLHFSKPLNRIMEFCKSGLEGNNMMLKLLLIFGLGILYFAFVLSVVSVMAEGR